MFSSLRGRLYIHSLRPLLIISVGTYGKGRHCKSGSVDELGNSSVDGYARRYITRSYVPGAAMEVAVGFEDISSWVFEIGTLSAMPILAASLSICVMLLTASEHFPVFLNRHLTTRVVTWKTGHIYLWLYAVWQ